MAPTTRSKRKRQQKEFEAELRLAAARRDLDRARELVELERVPVDCPNELGRTPMIYALADENLEMVRFLLDKGANADARNLSGHTLLVMAVTLGNTGLVGLLLEYGANIELKCLGFTPLASAICKGNSEMVTFLLQNGASVENVLRYPGEIEAYGALPLACRCNQIEIVQHLLDHGVDINMKAVVEKDDRSGVLSPLCESCYAGNLEIAKLLLRNGAKVLFPGKFYPSPPLIHAIGKGSLELVRLVLEHVVRAVKNTGDGSDDDESSSADQRLADCLGGKTLIYAICKQKLQVAQLLVDHGADLNKEPILALCARTGYTEGARFLLKAGANVNRAEKHDRTPLWIAAHEGHVDLVKQLLDAGADMNIQDSVGHETPMGVAHRKGHEDVVYLLLRTSPRTWPRLQRWFVGRSRTNE